MKQFLIDRWTEALKDPNLDPATRKALEDAIAEVSKWP